MEFENISELEWAKRPEEFLFQENEYTPPGEEYTPHGEEHGIRPPEFVELLAMPDPTQPAEPLTHLEKQEEQRKERKKSLLLQMAAIFASITLVSSSFSIDLLGSNILFASDGSGITLVQTDQSFPSLNNLTPNGLVPGYGILDEEYVLVSQGNEKTVLHCGAAYGNNSGESMAGATYDYATNTLTLDHFQGSTIEANLMGNGFTIYLKGHNTIDHLMVWGFFYGGSVTITGEEGASLTVNGQNGSYSSGILLESEYSESCLMIDSMVSVTASGTTAGVMVCATTASQGVWVKNPNHIPVGASRTRGSWALSCYGETQQDATDWTVVSNDTGEPLSVVTFAADHFVEDTSSASGETEEPGHPVTPVENLPDDPDAPYESA